MCERKYIRASFTYLLNFLIHFFNGRLIGDVYNTKQIGVNLLHYLLMGQEKYVALKFLYHVAFIAS